MVTDRLLLSLILLLTAIPAAYSVPRGQHARLGLSSNAAAARFDETWNTYCANLSEPSFFTPGDVDYGGPGFILNDLDYTTTNQTHYYFLYENNRDTHPWKYTALTGGSAVFISVCPTFRGRMVRGNPTYNLDGTNHNNLATWIEMAWDGPPSYMAWGDVSLLQGYDGSALLEAIDGSGVVTGFADDILTGAPANATTCKPGGGTVLDLTVGEAGNNWTRAYELAWVDPSTQAFVMDVYKPVIGSLNGRFAVWMYPGVY